VTVTVAMLPRALRFAVRADGDAVAAIGAAFGVALPVEACRANVGDDGRAALWLGPDEWLLVAPEGEAAELQARIAEGLAATPASVVEVSDRNVAIAIEGAEAAVAVNGFNPLDLALSAFPVGMCTRTVFGKAEAVLWRTGAEAFRIEVWRSFAPYVLGCLDEAIREYQP
jgi:sarcosine oxidase subunit gamma